MVTCNEDNLAGSIRALHTTCFVVCSDELLIRKYGRSATGAERPVLTPSNILPGMYISTRSEVMPMPGTRYKLRSMVNLWTARYAPGRTHAGVVLLFFYIAAEFQMPDHMIRCRRRTLCVPRPSWLSLRCGNSVRGLARGCAPILIQYSAVLPRW